MISQWPWVKAKVTEEQVAEMRRRHRAKEASAADLATEYGLGKMAVLRLLRGESWSWVAEPTSKLKSNVKGVQCKSHRLTEDDVRLIRKLYAPRGVDGYSYQRLARKFRVHASSIIDVVKYRSWKHIA
jgi:hypothetical protein